VRLFFIPLGILPLKDVMVATIVVTTTGASLYVNIAKLKRKNQILLVRILCLIQHLPPGQGAVS